MTVALTAQNVSLAWLSAMEHLHSQGGTAVHLVVTVEEPEREDPCIRKTLDAFLATRARAASVSTVANTIFPSALYRSGRGPDARARLYALYEQGRTVRGRVPANQRGTYFDRLISYPGRDGALNQLERIVVRLQRQLETAAPKSSFYEIGARTPEDTDLPDWPDLHVYEPSRDNALMGFPCLSHISLTLAGRHLNMAALYRNQHFLRKAYGNFLGLGRLLSFICREAGCEPGELMCIATHADAELGKRDRAALIDACRGAHGHPQSAA